MCSERKMAVQRGKSLFFNFAWWKENTVRLKVVRFVVYSWKGTLSKGERFVRVRGTLKNREIFELGGSRSFCSLKRSFVEILHWNTALISKNFLPIWPRSKMLVSRITIRFLVCEFVGHLMPRLYWNSVCFRVFFVLKTLLNKSFQTASHNYD